MRFNIFIICKIELNYFFDVIIFQLTLLLIRKYFKLKFKIFVISLKMILIHKT